MKKLKIGLFGFGVVGQGVYQALQRTSSLNVSIHRICVRSNKPRKAPAELFTTDREILLTDPGIDVIVEVIDDAEAAWQIARTALLNGKHVVSASKKMIVEHLGELLDLQTATGKSILYESAACASIPVIRNLEEYYDHSLLKGLRGIVNGSTNFILGKMKEEELDIRQATLEAQQLGFAESDPSLDLEGIDAVNKCCLLLAHAYGIVTHPSDILYTGIQAITPGDIAIALSKNQDIKLVAQAQKLSTGQITVFVLPQFVAKQDVLYGVRNEYNGVVITTHFADEQFFYGKGAGSLPTASAIVSDLSALCYGYKYEYKKLQRSDRNSLTNEVYLRVYLSYPDAGKVRRQEFEWLEEWHQEEGRGYLTGVIALQKLIDNRWWQRDGHSLILQPDGIIEEVVTRNLRRKSLELAGLVI
jgi:homoserine dehydrogenase